MHGTATLGVSARYLQSSREQYECGRILAKDIGHTVQKKLPFKTTTHVLNKRALVSGHSRHEFCTLHVGTSRCYQTDPYTPSGI
mmetsp:Transcript_25344/g.37373  ORF Transcript_25344/g.37373 Transcript_25344/m.37373 type:complete len:84 (-) Transcript_25344:1181-1432(-)